MQNKTEKKLKLIKQRIAVLTLEQNKPSEKLPTGGTGTSHYPTCNNQGR
jgi:hypothetical protein